MKENPRAGREQTVGELLLQVCRLIGERMRVGMEEIGLHKAQAFALFFLHHHEGLPQAEMARALHLAPASVTNMLQRMERDGWIERRADPADQRVSRVFLTERARELHEEAETCFHDLESDVTGALTAEEQAQLRKMLLKVRAKLGAHNPSDRQPPYHDREGEDS